MKIVKKIVMWIIFVTLSLCGLGSLPSAGGVLMLLCAVILLPIKKLQNVIKTIMPNKTIRMILILVLFILGAAFLPKVDSISESDTNGDQYGLTVAEQLELARNEQSETTEAETTEAETTEAETTEAETTVAETTVAETTPVISHVETETYIEPAKELTYVLNSNRKKIHYPKCSSVKDIKPENYVEFYGTLEEAKAMGYDSCGRCKP